MSEGRCEERRGRKVRMRVGRKRKNEIEGGNVRKREGKKRVRLREDVMSEG